MGKDNNLVRDGEETVQAIVKLVQPRCQRTAYMENILELITNNEDGEYIKTTKLPSLDQNSIAYRICAISLSQKKRI